MTLAAAPSVCLGVLPGLRLDQMSLLARSGEAFSQIIRVHHWQDFDLCIEVLEKWFDYFNYLRRLGKIKKHHSSTFAVHRSKVSCLRFEPIHKRLDCLAERAVFESFISLFDRYGDLQHYAHCSIPR